MNSNTLEFFVKMKDMMSGGLVKMANTAQQSFGKIQKNIETVTKKNDTLASSYNELKKRIGEVETRIQTSTSITKLREAKRELRELQQIAGSHAGNLDKKSWWSGAGKMAGLLGIGLSIGAVSGFAKDSVGAAMNFGATQKSFEVLTGSRTKGIGLANNLNKLQQDTILGPEVFKAAQTMMGFGIAGEKVVQIEKQIGDVSMGNKDKFEALTLAFSQTQAAGKLMGQDLLQYINAGFNPLQTMSEHWKEFGLKQKMTVRQLKESMEKGAISAQAVAKAFEIATSKGGKFDGMMDQIAQTSYGKMQILDGQWENLKIGSGNALMPIADSLMDVASKTMDWLNITKSAPATLMGEKAEIDTLIGSITALNEGNDLRHKLIQQLIVKYPDLFGKIDAENVKNNELLSTLNQVNAAYDRRITLASSDLLMDTNKKIAGEAQSEWVRNNAILMSLKQGDTNTAKVLMTPSERYANWVDNIMGGNIVQAIQGQANDAKAQMDAANGVIAKNQAVNQRMHLGADLDNTFSTAYSKMQDKDWLASLSKKDRKGFLALASNLQMVNGRLSTGKMGGVAYAASLNKYMTPSTAGAGGNQPLIGGGKGDKDGGIGKSVTSGGPRVININGVKFADKIEIHGESMSNAYDQTEKRLEEMFLRTLQSGAKVQ